MQHIRLLPKVLFLIAIHTEETTRQERLEKLSKALEEARKLQQDWMAYGLDCVNFHVEDVDGDWLEKWGEDEEPEAGAQP